MSMQIECPICGEVRDLPVASIVGTRTICRHCWALLEIKSDEPLQVVKIKLQAEDFGI
jgi:hypothetical protein